ncbi:MAG: hypothetical protein IJM59_02515 [Proteobacteria bacterium]|jgi:hypothetical protein|nr:hypothetical protein [Pseudomonadota bacterium]
MDRKEQKNKKAYVTPKIERLGKLSTLIQGSSGRVRDNFPQQGNKS